MQNGSQLISDPACPGRGTLCFSRKTVFHVFHPDGPTKRESK